MNLTDVFFTSVDEGWVSGEHATILHTQDGGSTWTAQVGGDPSNNERTIAGLRFLDARHGWAAQETPVFDGSRRMLRTTDGQNWQEIGEMPRGIKDYAFTSTSHGIALSNGSIGYRAGQGAIFLTDDTGKTWKPVRACILKTTVQGLAQTADCSFTRLRMLSAVSGYALASWRSPEAPNNNSPVIFRTDDAGRTWNYQVLPLYGAWGDADFFFTDAEHGLLVFQDGKTYATSDGATWQPMLATTIGPQIAFADPQVGWALAGALYTAFKISYTTDGGRHWSTTRDLRFPGQQNSPHMFSFPRRDRAYIIGEHGLVYRYRIVARNYTAPNALDAPAMPGISALGQAGDARSAAVASNPAQ